MERNLAFTRTRNNEHHIQLWTNGGTEILYLFPRHAIPVDPTEAFMGPEFAMWYASDGQAGPRADRPEPQEDLRAVPLGAAARRSAERNKIAQEIWKIMVDQQYGIGTVGQSPALMGVRIASQQARQHSIAGVHRPALPHAGRLASRDVVLQGLT